MNSWQEDGWIFNHQWAMTLEYLGECHAKQSSHVDIFRLVQL
jgi:hypothetical protein